MHMGVQSRSHLRHTAQLTCVACVVCVVCVALGCARVAWGQAAGSAPAAPWVVPAPPAAVVPAPPPDLRSIVRDPQGGNAVSSRRLSPQERDQLRRQLNPSAPAQVPAASASAPVPRP
jgi:hypothetical protein